MADYVPRMTTRRGASQSRNRPNGSLVTGNDPTFVSNMERVVKGASDGIVQTKQAIDESTGERPFGTKKLSERKQVQRYSLVRDDMNLWKQLIMQHGLKATIDYAIRMERLSSKYPDEAQYMNPEPLIERTQKETK